MTTFPLASNPAGFANVTWPTRNGTFYKGETVTATLSQAGATSYEVRDYTGTIVASGSVSGTALSLGTWNTLGWFRVYLKVLGNPDPDYGFSRGVSNFICIPTSTNFPNRPSATLNGNGAPGQHNDPMNIVSRGWLGIGPYRQLLGNVISPATGNDSIAVATADAAKINDWLLQSAYFDAARGLQQWIAFPNGHTTDAIVFSSTYLVAQPKDLTHDQTQVFVKTSAGTNAGTDKITVYYPNNTTVVETFDNLANNGAAETAVNASSNYIRVFPPGTNLGVRPGAYEGPTAFGTASRDGIYSIVSALYPLGFTHYEGPVNEPDMSAAVGGRWLAAQMKFVRLCVERGNASAKVIGPSPVAIDASQQAGWQAFFAAAGADECSGGLAFHAYNAVANGDLNLGRNVIETFLGWAADAGVSTSKVMWQTEATHTRHQIAGNPATTAGVYHPRRTRETMVQTLLWEQYGIPRERNPIWYDVSHGFWSYPAWLWHADASPQPTVAVYHTLARETYGMTFEHRIDFGSVPANRIFLGNIYGNAGGSVAAVMSASNMPSCSVTFTVTGTSAALTVVDPWGNETSAAQSSGRITVSLIDLPSFVRIPTGAHLSVYFVNDWGPTPSPSIGSLAYIKSLGGSPTSGIADETFLTQYTGGTTSPGYNSSAISLPDDAYVQFGQNVSVERVIVWCGAAWQSMPTLVDFDVDTWDGATWTTRTTVTDTTPSSFVHGSDSTNSGTKYDTYWDERWIFDVKLPSPVTCQGARIHVRAISYGGEPDSQAATSAGQGTTTPKLGIVEMAVLSPSTVTLGSGYDTEVLADSPNGFWHFGESSGTTAASQVNSPTVDGTYINSPTLGVAGPISDGVTAAQFTAASNQRVQVPDGSLTRLDDVLTLETWWKPLAVGSAQTLMGKVSGSTGYGMTQTSAGIFQLSIPGVTGIANSTATLATGNWYHLAATKNGSTIHLYVNGVDVTGTVTNQTLASTAATLTIGSNQSNTPTTGIIARPAIYPTALSAARILAHYRAGIAPAVPTISTAPRIQGVSNVGRQIGVYPGTSANATTRTYQWQDSPNGSTGWANLSGETRADYIIPSSKAGRYLRIQETATNAAGSSSASSSAAVLVPGVSSGQRVGWVAI